MIPAGAAVAAEKIDSIRINQLGSFGPSSDGSSHKAPVNQALDAIMGMAIQLPALRKLGDEIGVNFNDGLSSLGGDNKK
jgi:flotillin